MISFGVATVLYFTVQVLDVSHPRIVALSEQWGSGSKGRAFPDAFISKIPWELWRYERH